MIFEVTCKACSSRLFVTWGYRIKLREIDCCVCKSKINLVGEEMSRKKKKLRFYNKNPNTDTHAEYTGLLLRELMPKEEIEKVLLETGVFGTGWARYTPPKRDPLKVNIRCPECTLDIEVVQASTKENGNIDCPNCKANLHWSIGKNEKGDKVTFVTCGRLAVRNPSLYVVLEDNILRDI